MDTSILIPTIAKKFHIDIGSDSKIMLLFNKICGALETIKHLTKVIEQNNSDYAELEKRHAAALVVLMRKQVNMIHYYKPYLKTIPGVQDPDCTLLFQTESNLIQGIDAIERSQLPPTSSPTLLSRN